MSYIYANLLGNEAGRVIYDGGGLIASGGNIVAEGKRFSFEDVQLVTASIDLDRNQKKQTEDGKSVRSPDQLARVAFEFPRFESTLQDGTAAEWEKSTDIKEEEFTRAVSLGLFDYLRKSRSHGFIVSLSGGCDSASVATLVAMAVNLQL